MLRGRRGQRLRTRPACRGHRSGNRCIIRGLQSRRSRFDGQRLVLEVGPCASWRRSAGGGGPCRSKTAVKLSAPASRLPVNEVTRTCPGGLGPSSKLRSGMSLSSRAFATRRQLGPEWFVPFDRRIQKGDRQWQPRFVTREVGAGRGRDVRDRLGRASVGVGDGRALGDHIRRGGAPGGLVT